MREIQSVEEMAALAPGTLIVNSFLDYFGNRRETVFRLRIKENGAPYLYGRLGTHHKVKATDFAGDDRWFVAEAKKSAR